MLRLLCFTAHPDDEAGSFGGTLLRYAEHSVETQVICLTPGQAATHRGSAKSDDELSAARRLEFDAACKLLKVSRGTVLDYPDGKLDRQDFFAVVSLAREGWAVIPTQFAERREADLRAERPVPGAAECLAGPSFMAVWSKATRSMGYNKILRNNSEFGRSTGSTGGVLMKASFKAMWLLASLGILMVVAIGCNDTLRQFIVPVPSPSGDPGTLSHAITLSTNPVVPPADGSDMHIDVSGDSSVGIVPLGVNPVFLGKTSNRVFIINSGDPSASIPPSVSTYIALLPTSTVSTVTLPSTSSGPVAGATNSAGNIYIANRLSNTIDLISGSVLAVTSTIPLPAGDSNPVMIAGNTANNKIFVVNQNSGSGTVTEISTIDNTVIKDIPVGSNPIWAVMSTDGLFVFVVNQGDGTVSVIDTSLDIILPCAVSPSCPTGTAIKVGTTAASSPNFAFYDSKLRRVYVSNTGTGENTISVIQANGLDLGSNPQVLPTKLADIHVSDSPTSLTALSDGTRVYAALGHCPAGVNHLTLPDPASLSNASHCPGNLVSVIDAVGLRETGTITVGPGAISVDASTDASRVYVISANDITTVRDDVHPSAPLPDRTFPTPSISIIKTATNSVLATPVDQSIVNRPLPTFHVPQQDPACVPTIDPNFNTHVPLPCPLQTPFVVRTFP